MSRQQARLMRQRRRPYKLQQEAEARSALDRQWRVKLHGETRVSKWWNCGDEDGATKLAITYSNLNCDQRGVAGVEQAMTSAYGCPCPSTSSSSLAATNTAADLAWRTSRAAIGTTGGDDELDEMRVDPGTEWHEDCTLAILGASGRSERSERPPAARRRVARR
ncbi:hypothetical protein PR003_g25288 [Phytophthora rubi]|uniref:Uncharacterized protein n=1 Tax=Phytophthora rubi TaxID=129364 RepID=A0A6A4CHH0_9STRA|nr:hypothetical protein PR002_g31547 [Phytophthora rubi]KAE9290447.1 hypothetical protein PR003_g25288 [Phytophthora rubi]